MTATVLHADCRDALAAMDAASVDAIVTDPPYGLSFMGKGWDHGVPGVEFWTAALRVAKPGAYLLAFGGTRTFHRLACAIEDAGWEVHDCLSWLYGSGFPKHASKLKPAWEPIVLARRPAPRATPLQVDACRIATDENLNGGAYSANATPRAQMWGADAGNSWRRGGAGEYQPPAGRWPANVVLDEDAAAALDAQSGELPGRPAKVMRRGVESGRGIGSAETFAGGAGRVHEAAPFYGDTGGASRFFYTAKASRREREAGLDGFPVKPCGTMEDDGYAWEGEIARGRKPRDAKRANAHPTVKPLALMRWLVRLVTPPGGLVLDPFTGSGSTGCAAVLEGRRFVGVEREADYVAIARARIAHWSAVAERERASAVPAVAPSLFDTPDAPDVDDAA